MNKFPRFGDRQPNIIYVSEAEDAVSWGELMGNGAELEQKEREDARWRILRVLDAGRPIGVNERIVWRVLHDVKIGLSPIQVRRELEYLQDLGLAKLEDVGTETSSAKLTAHGVDVVEYTVESPPGIARPKKYC